MSESAVGAVAKEKPRFVRALAALKDRRMLAMLLLSFAAGLPYGAVLGTLNAWLTEGGVDVRAIGAFSIITLAYSFKFLWAPVFQKAQYPLPSRLGPRRAWLLSFQMPITVMLIVLALGDPVANIGFAALLALLTAVFSASHDIVLDAWRIEVARSEEDKDLMSALYQFGYRLSGLITGFIALLMAERIGWMGAYLIISGVMAVSMIGTLIAPEPKSDVSNAERPSYTTLLHSQQTRMSAGLVSIAWLIAFLLIAWFVSQALTTDPPPSGRGFVLTQGPIIVGLCIIFPAALAASLLPDFGKSPSVAYEHADEGRIARVLNGLFRGILDPLMDLIARLRWGALIVLSLALMYRFTDAVWGGYAYPFYLGEDHGALGHSLDDVAVASKFFGVIMTVSGAALGVFAVSVFGRMTCLIAGAVVAAATNLLFADLAASASFTDGILNITQLDLLLGSMAEWSYSLLGTAAENRTGADRMARLMLVIAAENLAGGFASVAIVIYLTSVVNPRFAAVQYALLASLSLLVGTLGRPLLGDIINEQGFYTVFIITFWLGMIAVVLCVVEALRRGLSLPDQASAPA